MLVDLEEIAVSYITVHSCKEKGQLGVPCVSDVFNPICFFEDDECPGFCSNYIYGAMDNKLWKLSEYLCKKYKFADLICMSICVTHGKLEHVKLLLKFMDLTEEDVLELITVAEDAEQDRLVEFFERYHYYNYR